MFTHVNPNFSLMYTAALYYYDPFILQKNDTFVDFQRPSSGKVKVKVKEK